jgi:hypothetical protein
VDENFPILGGKTLRLFFGVTLCDKADRPIVAIRGVSLGGVPLPSAWWGDIKNKNLVEEFGSEGGFWDQFSKKEFAMRGNVVDMAVGIIYVLRVSPVSLVLLVSQLLLLSVHSSALTALPMECIKHPVAATGSGNQDFLLY